MLKMNLTDQLELDFATKTYKILKAFVNQTGKSKIKFNDFLIKHHDKYFSKKNNNKELSEFLSTMVLRNISSEI